MATSRRSGAAALRSARLTAGKLLRTKPARGVGRVSQRTRVRPPRAYAAIIPCTGARTRHPGGAAAGGVAHREVVVGPMNITTASGFDAAWRCAWLGQSSRDDFERPVEMWASLRTSAPSAELWQENESRSCIIESPVARTQSPPPGARNARRAGRAVAGVRGHAPAAGPKRCERHGRRSRSAGRRHRTALGRTARRFDAQTHPESASTPAVDHAGGQGAPTLACRGITTARRLAPRACAPCTAVWPSRRWR